MLDALRLHGAQEIFGIPGDFVLPFFKVVEESGVLPFYTLSPRWDLRPMRRRGSMAASRWPWPPGAPGR